MPFLYSRKQESLYPEYIQLDSSLYKIECPFIYIYNEDDIYKEILIPKGFITDFGSVPQIFQNIIPRADNMVGAYVVHDLIYAAESFSRKMCDDILLMAFYELGAGWWKRNTVYSMVRMFGGSVWSGHEIDKVQDLQNSIAAQRIAMSHPNNESGILYNVFTDKFELI